MVASLNQQWLKTIGLVSGLVACLGGVIFLQQSRINTVTGQLGARNFQQEINTEKIQINFLKSAPSFGFKNLVADWSMLKFIQYYGDTEARQQTGYSLSPDYLDIIVKNDPRFIRAYLTISPASSINAGLPERTIAAMEQGLKRLSPNITNAYFIWLYKGVDELLFLGDIEAAKHSYMMTAKWAKLANNPLIEKSALGTVQYLSNNPDSHTAQVGAWFLVWTNSRDKQTRQIAHRNIESLGGKLIIRNDGLVSAIPPRKD